MSVYRDCNRCGAYLPIESFYPRPVPKRLLYTDRNAGRGQAFHGRMSECIDCHIDRGRTSRGQTKRPEKPGAAEAALTEARAWLDEQRKVGA